MWRWAVGREYHKLAARRWISLYDCQTVRTIKQHHRNKEDTIMAGLRGVLLGMGNPLLDISAVVEQSLLDKYKVRVVQGWTG